MVEREEDGEVADQNQGETSKPLDETWRFWYHWKENVEEMKIDIKHGPNHQVSRKIEVF